MNFDALLVLSFGGPNGPDDVIPFLENVLRGRNVPRERMLEVAEHYYHFGGKSPINEQNLALIAELRKTVPLPVYFGNRNWTPYVADALRQMHADGHRNIAVFATSAFGSWSGCRQYREDMIKAIAETGLNDLTLVKLPLFSLRDDFIAVMADRVREAAAELPDAQELVFTAHSIPTSMAQTGPYVPQLQEASRRVAEAAGFAGRWKLVYQSRSGPPSQPWLEPDVVDYIKSSGLEALIVCPIGFISDHMEVLYDLDTEAKELCDELGIRMVRAGTAGTHPQFVELIAKLVAEGQGSAHDARCFADCCPTPPQRPAAPATAAR